MSEVVNNNGGWIKGRPRWRFHPQDAREGRFGEEFLVFPRTCGSTAFYGTRCSQEPNWYHSGTIINGITHYMPLPAPPETETK